MRTVSHMMISERGVQNLAAYVIFANRTDISSISGSYGISGICSRFIWRVWVMQGNFKGTITSWNGQNMDK